VTPSYEFLPAPLELLTLLHLVTLTLHFVAMGALVGGLGTLALAGLPGKWQRPAVGRFVRLLPTLMSLTVTLGVAPLLFLQLVYHRQVYAAAIVSAWLWLGLLGAAMIAYYLLYTANRKPESGGTRNPLPLLAALLLLVFVALVFTSVFTLAERPATIAAAWAADSSGAVLNPEVSRWLPRWLHALAGALLVGAFVLAFFAGEDEELAASVRVSALGSAAAAVVLGVAALVGLGDDLVPYMRSPAVWWLLISFVLMLAALHLLFRRQLVPAAGALGVSLFAMVVQRHLARTVVLRDAFDPATIPEASQWGVFALFLACFVAMAAAVAWMLRLFFAPAARR
jgi:hypothetical protein